MTSGLKQKVKDRDKFCQFCGSTKNLSVDHIVPQIEGGLDVLENLQVLCEICNKRKGPIPPLRFRIANLFNGNIYHFKREIRDVVGSCKQSLSNFKQSLEDKLRVKFSDLDKKLANQEATNGILIKRLAEQDLKINDLTRTLHENQAKLIEAIIKVEGLAADRIMALEDYHKIEWHREPKIYKKIKK